MQTIALRETQTKPPQSAGPLQVLLKTLSEANGKLTRRLDIRDELDEAQRLLESFLMSTEEFALACNRLWNAGRFANSGEYGAANWELRTLQSWVARYNNVNPPPQ